MKGKRLWTALACVAMLAGCAIVPLDDPYYDAPMVRMEPPPPPYEYIGSPPVVGHIWIEGYWNWVGTRYVWIPGRWDAPRPGYHWTPRRWERHDDNHWRSYGGRWERGESPRPIAPIPPPHRDKPRLPPSHTDRRDPPHIPPPPPRSEREHRRPMEVTPNPPMERRAEPPGTEHPARNERRRDSNRDADRRSDSR